MASEDTPTANNPLTARRSGRGSLADVLACADDWDSAETNAAIADEFER